MKLEKVEVGGYHGRSQSHQLVELYEAYGAAFGRLRNIQYDPLDLADNSFLQDYEVYMGQIRDFDQKLSHIISVSYDDCNNFEAIFKVSCFKLSLFGMDMLSSSILKRSTFDYTFKISEHGLKFNCHLL